MMGSLPLGLVYSSRAVRRAPDRSFAGTGLGLSLLALLGIGALVLYSILDR